MARPFLSAVQVEGPQTRRSELDSLEYAVWAAARDRAARRANGRSPARLQPKVDRGAHLVLILRRRRMGRLR